jgi:FMN-dependent oxidoreductase (nitrilotriacetate monooxygenase family)
LLSILAAETTHLGLAGTMSTTYYEPYNVARLIASLDQLSGGRAGWNIVTSSQPSVAANYGPVQHPEHALRYDRSEEFIEIVKGLWGSWGAGAVIADQKEGVFLDPAQVERVIFDGDHFSVQALFNIPRSPQGRPVLFHAGSSDIGRAQGARHADGIFTAQPEISAAREFYADYKRRIAAAGRRPEDVLVLPGYLPVIGSTEAEAQDLFTSVNALIDTGTGISSVNKLLGLDLSEVDLDAPVPDNVWAAAGASFTSRVAVIRDHAEHEGFTARQVMERAVGGFGHYVVVGTPEQVADDIEHWFTTGAADGFNLKPLIAPQSIETFVEHVVPLLQAKGIYRREYTATTLRGHYGLPDPD